MPDEIVRLEIDDYDSYPVYGVNKLEDGKGPSYLKTEISLSKEEYDDLGRVLLEYERWQKKLEELYEASDILNTTPTVARHQASNL